MTSRISSYRLRRENIKHRLGIVLVNFFTFFAYLIGFLISVQGTLARSHSVKPAEVVRAITELSEPSFMNMGLLAVMDAAMLAVSGFAYLHSKKKIDLYHALPVKRKSIYVLTVTNDIALFAAPLAVMLAVKCLIVAAVGYMSPVFLTNTFSSFVCYLAVFAVVYLTMALAFILTGQTFVGILGFFVFGTYAPLILRNFYPTLAGVFFKTWANEPWGAFLDYFSPLSLAGKILSDYGVWQWKAHIAAFAIACVWAAVLFFVCLALFDRRRSESAGKAMAFPKTKPVIRILLTIPLAVYGGLLLYTISFTSFLPWIIVGVVIGAFLVHGVIECIYQSDVRGLWSHRGQMFACMAAAFVIIGIFWADVTGYDAYVPDTSGTEAVLIDLPNESTYWGKERKGISGDSLPGTLDALRAVVEANDRNWEIFYDDTDMTPNSCELFTITYRLKGGKEKKRTYVLDTELKDRLFAEVFDTKEFKEDMYSLYTADWSRVKEIDIDSPAQAGALTAVSTTAEQREKLFATYLEELSALDYETARKEPPVAEMVLFYDDSSAEEADGIDPVYPEDSGSGEDYYFIYPSFEKTLECLRELGMDAGKTMADLDITDLEYWNYDSDDVSATYLIRDKDKIDELKGRLFYGLYSGYTGIEGIYDFAKSADIQATVRTADGPVQFSVYTDPETFEKIKEAAVKE